MSKWILCVLVSSGIGSLLYGIWYGMSRWLDGKKYVAAIYHSLHVVTVFFSLFAFCGIAVSLFLEKIPTGTFWGYHNAALEMAAGVLCTVWMAGAVWNLARYVYFHRLHSKMIRGLEQCDGEVQTVSAQVAEDMGIRNVPHMRTGHVLFTAELSGWRRPWVLLPDYDYTREQLEGIVAHELTHFVHGDRWVRELAVVTHCVHWFNPLVKNLHCSLENWDELYCDSCVCSYDFISSREYAGTLLYMSEQFVEKKKSILDVAFSERGTHMIERIRCILDQTGERAKRSTTITITSLFVLMGMLAAVMAGCATYEAYDEFTAGSISGVPEEDQPQVSWKEEKEMIGTGGLAEFVGGYVEQIASASSSFQCTLKNGRWASGGFQAWEGQNIAVALFSEKNVQLRVGILDPAGWLHYVSGSGDIAHTFQVEQTGAYHLVIYSESVDSVDVMGIYYTRGEAGKKQMDIRDMTLFCYKNGEYGQIVTAETAYEYWEHMVPAIREETLYGQFCEEAFPAEADREQYQYAHYMRVFDQGDAFSVTTHLLTVYDGLEERLALIWVEDESKEWTDYELIEVRIYDYMFEPFVLGGEAYAPALLSYQVGLNADIDAEAEEHLKRFGFSKSLFQDSDWIYYKSENINASIFESVFEETEKRRELLQAVWDQLSDAQKETIHVTWEEGAISVVNVAIQEEQSSVWRPYHLAPEYKEEYYDQYIYEVAYPANTSTTVLVSRDTWQIIGDFRR